ncbi:hypothetical protein HRI_001209100 [Hibiscus trionum]|uniref:AT3G52170-like helix-turn-helix domain-containing protein n=1 Tax=Hibiscus trionum TaxID=183268 RepID=A0A9W7HEH1_HIBTR|nr:hypothetical protein HRI_001209100 [Hibiscus trionum]
MQIVRGGRVFCSNYSAAPATWVGVRRVRSFAASLPSPSDSPKRKRISKAERRALIESFVNRYRSMNAGKFPSITEAKKEVGGSFYVVRKVLQELEYKPNVCSSSSSYEKLSAKVVNKEDKSFSVVEVVSTGLGIQDATCAKAVDDVKILDTNDKQLEADRDSFHDFVSEENSVVKIDAKGLERQADDKVEDVGIDSSDKFQMFPNKQKSVKATDQDLESEELSKTEFQGVESDFGVVKGDILKEETEIGNEEGDEKVQTPSKELLGSGSPELKAEQLKPFVEEEKYARNHSSEQTNDAESSKKSSLWGNLKSFADGIINIWRKL